jgi:YHS domain-containing protein
MSKKAILGVFLVMALLLGQFAFVMAQEKPAPPSQKPAVTQEKPAIMPEKPVAPQKPVTPPAKQAETKNQPPKTMPIKPNMPMKTANMVAICGCGMVFEPNEKTKYFEYEGKKYAVCSDACYEMAMKNPADVAKMADYNMAKLMQPMSKGMK